MAVGQVIGRVSVKVMPDTKEFRRDAERQLSKVEKSIRVMIPTRLDMTGAKLDMLKAVRALNQENRTKDSRKVAFFARMDNSGMDAEITKAVRTLTNKARNQKVKFNADVAAALVEARIDKAQLKEVRKQLEDWRDDMSPLKVGVRPEIVNGSTTWVEKRLDYLTRPRAVKVAPFLEPGSTANVATALAALSGARVLGTMFEDIFNSLKRLDKSVPIIGTLAYATQGLAAFALAGASNLFALSSSLAQIGPAALAIPGIFGGIAIGLGATFAVMKDFNKVLPEVQDKLSALQDRMSANFWSVAEGPIRQLINTLLPQFSDGLAKASTELGGFFAKFATGLEGQFNGALAGMFKDLADSIAIAGEHTDSFAAILRILGEVGAGYLPQLAGWFGNLADRFAGFLEKAQSDGSLQGWIDTGIAGLMTLSSAIGSIGGILAGLANAASLGGGAGLTNLADSLDHINEIVNGSDFLGHFVTVLTAANTAMDRISQTAGPALGDFLSAFSLTLGKTLPIVGSTFGAIGDAIFSALAGPKVQSAFTGMIAQFSIGVDGLLPAIAPLGDTFATLMDVIGALAMNLGPVLGTAFGALAGPVSTIGQALIPIINMLGPILTQTITALTPLFQSVAAKFVEITTAAQPLIQRIGELIAFLMPVLVPALQFVASVIGDSLIGVINGAIMVFDGIKTAVQGFIDLFSGVVMIFSGDIQGGFAKVWEGIKGIFSGAFTAIIGAIKVWFNFGILSFVKGGVKSLLTTWKGGWEAIETAVKGVWTSIKSFISTAFTAVKTAISGTLNSISLLWSATWLGIKTYITTVWTAIKTAVQSGITAASEVITSTMTMVKNGWMTAWEAIKSILTVAWSTMRAAVQTGITKVMDLIRGLPGSIKGVFSNAGRLLLDIGRRIIDGLGAGIDAGKQWIIDKVKALGDLIPGWLKKRLGIHSPSRVTKEIGKFVGQGLANGIAGTQGEVTATMSKLLGMVQKTTNKKAKAIVQTAAEALKPLAKQFESLGTDIDTAQQDWERLKDAAKDYAREVKNAIIATGDLTKVEGLTNEDGVQMAVTYDDLRGSLKKAVKDAHEFNNMWTALRDLGLNDTSLQQFMDAGPAALDAMKAIFEAPIGSVGELNDLQKELAQIGGNVADKAVAQFHQAGINTAKGFLDGLITDQEKVAEAMRGIAKAMVKALKDELDIHSPSRVFKTLGGHVVGGLTKGLDNNGMVLSAMSSLGTDMKDSGKSMIDGMIDGMESRYGAVQSSLENMSTDLAVNAPSADSASLSAIVGGALATDGTGVYVEQKVLNYHAAPNNSLDSEDDLFAAAERGRMVGW